MMKLPPFLSPLFGLTLLASCSSAVSSHRDPQTLEGRSRAEILAEFGKPFHSSKYMGRDAGKVADDSFRVDSTWRLSEPKPESIFDRINRRTANATETLFLPITLGSKAREAVTARELTVQYLPDKRQTVRGAYVRIP